MDLDETHSDSNVNESWKPLICKNHAAAPQTLTVTFTVIGSGINQHWRGFPGDSA
jgi:hypothetical protein